MLTFDQEKHEYKYNGLKVPGVTTVLSDVGISDFSMVPEKILTLAIERGNAVHKATELFDLGKLDENSVTPKINNYFEQYKKYLKDYDVVNHEVEYRFYCPKYKYCGTLDRILTINGELAVLDIKTGIECISHGIQTSAYEFGYRKIIKFRKKLKRYTLFLYENKYKLEENKNRLDFDIFLAALQIYQFKKTYK